MFIWDHIIFSTCASAHSSGYHPNVPNLLDMVIDKNPSYYVFLQDCL
jgi:hypothetical protein